MTNIRQDKLLALINDKGYYTVDELADEFDVSTQTIRRDIKKLSDDRLLVRHHGGASSPSTKTNLDYDVRKVSETDQKNAIAKSIAEMIPDNSTVFITIGTTAEIIASHLYHKKNLQVITNSIRIASLLHSNKTFDVIIPSGKIKAFNGGIVSTDALEFISNFRTDYVITSVASIDTDGTLLEYDLNETMITQAVMKSTRHVILAVDSSKFIPKGSIELGHLKKVDFLFTDMPLTKELDQVTANAGVSVEICKDD